MKRILHEMSNKLTGIMGLVELLELKDDQEELSRKQIIKLCDDMTHLIRVATVLIRSEDGIGRDNF